MHDLKEIRTNPEAFDQAMARRGLPVQSPDILRLDASRRDALTRLQELQNQRNVLSKDIGIKKSKGENVDAVMAEVAKLKSDIELLEKEEAEFGIELDDILSRLPNVQAADIPDGADETANVEMRKVGEPVRLNAPAPDHVSIGEALRMMDFETAAKLSGARFVWLQNGLARMERALANFMLDTHTTEHGYTEVSPPILVRDNAAFGTGNLPKFADDLFKTTNGFWLIPTAEVSLTNYVADMITDEEKLPLRFTALTPCFRSEAGSAGRDTRGMLRQHQFYKVEMVSITTPETSVAEHERMTGCAENILKKLGLSFRTIVLCTGDAGFCSHKTYDLEVWLPGQQTYREISSCSNCTDFQARRMKARCRKAGEKETRFVHTLNGSGVAVGRALIAVMENYWDADKQVLHIPPALQPYMGGQKVLAA